MDIVFAIVCMISGLIIIAQRVQLSVTRTELAEAMGAIEEQEFLIDNLRYDLGQARRRGSRKAGIIDRARRA